MTNFKAYVEINGEWEEITPSNSECSGQPVFPLNYGQMLDERLNEAYLHIRKCSVPNFHPDTEFRIDVIENARTDQEKTTSFYYIVARDNAIERPIGSGRYRHEIYLIERTKKLEGIVCQSITFTNPKGNVFTNAAYKVSSENVLTNDAGFGQPEAENVPTLQLEEFKNPIGLGEVVTVASLGIIASMVSDAFQTNQGWDNKIIVRSGGSIIREYEIGLQNYFETYQVSTTNNDLSVQYVLHGTVRGTQPFTGYLYITFTMSAVENRYPLRPYTIADCIDRCLLLAEPLFGNEQPRYRLDPDQREKYEKIYAPQFSMTQCTLREQLKVIGGNIHAEPRLLGGDKSDIIHFDDLGAGEEWTPSEPYVFNQQSQDINEYCTSVDTSASNIINTMDYAQGVIYSPNRNDVLTLRTESVYVRIDETNGFAYTQFPIYDIVKVECGIFEKNENGETYYFSPKDITPYIFEQTEYFANLSSYDGGYPNSKAYALYFARGERHIKGLFFKVENAVSSTFEYYSIVNILSAVTGVSQSNIRDQLGGNNAPYAGNLFFRISYIPYYSTRFSHGKPYVEDKRDEFSKIYNQSENLIETRYYGENIKGVAARLGNVEQTRTYRFSSLASVPQIGQTVDGYAISAVNVSVLPVENMGVKVTVALSKDFNRISQYVGIQSRKRTYEVSEKEAYLRNVMIREYCVLGKRKNYERGMFRDLRAISSIFSELNMNPYSAVSAYFTSGNGEQQGEVMLPVISSAFGNVMTFSWSYKDNYSAGDRASWETVGGVSGFFQNDVPYCDYYGRIKQYFFRIMEGPSTPTSDIAEVARNLPSREYYPGNPDISVSSSSLGGYRMMKDSREVINMNFSLEFKSNLKSLIVGSALPANSGAVRAKDGDDLYIPKIYSLSKKVGKFQNRITDEPLDVSTGESVSVLGELGTQYIEIPQEFRNATAWAICLPQHEKNKIYDRDGSPDMVTEMTGGDILLACNDPEKFWEEADIGSNGSRRIYLNLARNIYN